MAALKCADKRFATVYCGGSLAEYEQFRAEYEAELQAAAQQQEAAAAASGGLAQAGGAQQLRPPSPPQPSAQPAPQEQQQQQLPLLGAAGASPDGGASLPANSIANAPPLPSLGHALRRAARAGPKAAPAGGGPEAPQRAGSMRRLGGGGLGASSAAADASGQGFEMGGGEPQASNTWAGSVARSNGLPLRSRAGFVPVARSLPPR